MTKTIKLHGILAKKYGKTVEIAGDNMRQIMDGLIHRFGTEFKEEIRQGNWHITNGAIKKGNDLSEHDLDKHLPKEVVNILPAVAGGSGALRTIIGVILIVVGVYFGQQWLVNIGISMALGGVVEMLTQPPEADQQKIQDEGGGSIFNSAQNVTTQGGPVPLIFGRVRRASSVVISTNFSSEEVPYLEDPDEYDKADDGFNFKRWIDSVGRP